MYLLLHWFFKFLFYHYSGVYGYDEFIAMATPKLISQVQDGQKKLQFDQPINIQVILALIALTNEKYQVVRKMTAEQSLKLA